MTTLNLSVGLKTESARESLKAFKSAVQAELKGAVLAINDASLVSSVQAALKKQKFGISFDSDALRRDVGKSLTEAFAVRQQVHLDSEHLTSQVRAAVGAGLHGASLGAAGASGAGIAGVAGLKTTITEILAPHVEELGKAASLVASVARQAGLQGASSRARASESFSFRDEEGKTTRHTLPLTDPSIALANITAGNAAKLEEQRQKGLLALNNALGNQRVREQDRAQSAPKIDPATLLGLPTRDSMKSMGAQIAAQMRDGAVTEALRAKSASGVDPRTLLGLPTEGQSRAIGNQIAAQMKEGAQNARMEVARFYEEQKIVAAKSFTGAGTRIAAAAATAQQFGPDATTAFLGTKAGLLNQVSDLESYRRAVKGVGDAHVEAGAKARTSSAGHHFSRAAMNDAHSAARGLAGSLGALWVTWGSTVPIVAAAALGGALRSVIQVGKDVEFQLRFVQVLTGGVAISAREFGEAVRGSLSTPMEAAQGLRALAQNGLSARESLAALPTILNLATAGEMTLTAAALGATGVMAAFNLTVGDLPRVADVFTKAAALSNTSVQMMVESMKQASTVGDLYHVSIETTAAGLATLAQRNITGTAAGTAYRNMWIELSTPTRKASEALKQAGVNVFDANHQLLDADEALKRLHARVSTLNEQSKLTFLNDVFGERGAKAANAILSSFDEYEKTLKRIKEESADFTQTVVSALNEEAAGKMKALVTEFQLTAVGAFEESSSAVKNFIDDMRMLVSSNEFRQGLSTLTRAVIDLTKFLVENGKTILEVVVVYQSVKWLLAAAEAFSVLRTAVTGTTVAISAFGVASRAALGLVTGGVSLLAGLGIGYLLLRDKTDSATDAQDAYNNSLKLETERLDRSSKAMEDRVRLLDLQIRYQREGLSLTDAREKAEKSTTTQSVTDVKGELLRRQVNEQRLKNLLDENAKRGSEDKSIFGDSSIKREHDDLTKQLAAEQAAIASTKSSLAAAEKNANDKVLLTDREFQSKRLSDIHDFNRKVEEAIKNAPKLKRSLGGLTIDEATAPTDRAGFEKLLADRTAGFNKGATNLPRVDHAAERQARSEDLAASRALIKQSNDEMAALKQQARFRKEIDEARYNTKDFGPYMAAAAADFRQISDTTAALDLERTQRQRLQALVDHPTNLKPQDITMLEAEIAHRKVNVDLLEAQLKHESELAAIRATSRAAESARQDQSLLNKIKSDAGADAEKIKALYANKIVDGGSAASSKAQLQFEDQYRDEIRKHTEDLVKAQAASAILQAQASSAVGDQRVVAEGLYATSLKQVDVEHDRLTVLNQVLQASSLQVRTVARQQFDQSQTAGFGWDKFWADYRNNAESSSKQVYDMMGRTTSGMTEMFARFVTTGKLDFKGFVASVLADAARITASRAVLQLLGMATSFFSSGVPTADGSGATGDFARFDRLTPVGSANGNIMTAFGAMPLRKYVNGGIERSPQASIFAEGRLPEAYVPLPDGRSIPVTIQGGGEGGGATNINMTINVAANGKTDVESDGSGQKAAALGKLVEQGVMGVIVREKRPGGLLYATS